MLAKRYCVKLNPQHKSKATTTNLAPQAYIYIIPSRIFNSLPPHQLHKHSTVYQTTNYHKTSTTVYQIITHSKNNPQKYQNTLPTPKTHSKKPSSRKSCFQSSRLIAFIILTTNPSNPQRPPNGQHVQPRLPHIHHLEHYPPTSAPHAPRSWKTQSSPWNRKPANSSKTSAA